MITVKLSMFLLTLFIASLILITGSSHGTPTGNVTPVLNRSEITTSWNLSFLFEDKDKAKAEFERLSKKPQEMNATFRPRFMNLTGSVLLDYIEEQKSFSENLSIVSAYVYASNSLNVNDKFFEEFISDVQNLSTENYKATSFAEIKLKSLSMAEWDKLFLDEPGLEKYRAYLESNYQRYRRPQAQERVACCLLSRHIQPTDEDQYGGGKEGDQQCHRSREYYFGKWPGTGHQLADLLRTSLYRLNRNNRKMGYDKRFYHLINESDRMAEVYNTKARLDDLLARELNYTDSYDAKMFETYLTKEQVEIMNMVFKERKNDFDGYYEFRRTRMNLDSLKPYDLALQLMKNPRPEIRLQRHSF